MDRNLLSKTAAAMVARGKGLLAADESSGTCEKRFKSVGVECTEANRRAYRDLLFTTKSIEEFVSGVILFDETSAKARYRATSRSRDTSKKRVSSRDQGGQGHARARALSRRKGDRGTGRPARPARGLFRARCALCQVARGDHNRSGIPSHACLYANAHALARYSALCQEASIVPIVEPEVLLDGDHTIERCYEATEATLTAVFAALRAHNVSFEHTVLKASMVVSGKDCRNRPESSAWQRIRCVV